jgi:hypothetical protein
MKMTTRNNEFCPAAQAPLRFSRINHATGYGVINKQHEHANNRYFDVPSTYALALSATGFGGVEAIPHRAQLSGRAFDLLAERDTGEENCVAAGLGGVNGSFLRGGALTFIPVLSLGPIVEHLLMYTG